MVLKATKKTKNKKQIPLIHLFTFQEQVGPPGSPTTGLIPALTVIVFHVKLITPTMKFTAAELSG